MFYLTEVEYVGPDAARLIKYEIRTEPGQGLIGTVDRWSEIDRGEFETIDDVMSEIEDLCGDEGYRIVQEDDLNLNRPQIIVPGRCIPMSWQESQDWCFEFMNRDIEAHFTDDDIEDWFDKCYESAIDEGYLLDRAAVIEMATEYRDELNEDEDDEDV